MIVDIDTYISKTFDGRIKRKKKSYILSILIPIIYIYVMYSSFLA